MDLVSVLLEQHRLLRSEFEAIASLYRSPSGNVSQRLHDKMQETKHFVLAHMQLEDERFYPILIGGRMDSAISARADQAMKEFHDLAGRYLEFIERYESLDTAPKRVAFIQEFSHFVRAINDRMQVEEKELYPLYGAQAG